MSLHIIVTLSRRPEESNLDFRARTAAALAEVHENSHEFGLSSKTFLVRADSHLNVSIHWMSCLGDRPLPDNVCHVCARDVGELHELNLDPVKVQKARMRLLSLSPQSELPFGEAATRL